MAEVDMAEVVREMIESIVHCRRFRIRVNQCRRDIAAPSYIPVTAIAAVTFAVRGGIASVCTVAAFATITGMSTVQVNDHFRSDLNCVDGDRDVLSSFAVLTGSAGFAMHGRLAYPQGR